MHLAMLHSQLLTFLPFLLLGLVTSPQKTLDVDVLSFIHPLNHLFKQRDPSIGFSIERSRLQP